MRSSGRNVFLGDRNEEQRGLAMAASYERIERKLLESLAKELGDAYCADACAAAGGSTGQGDRDEL